MGRGTSMIVPTIPTDALLHGHLQTRSYHYVSARDRCRFSLTQPGFGPPRPIVMLSPHHHDHDLIAIGLNGPRTSVTVKYYLLSCAPVPLPFFAVRTCVSAPLELRVGADTTCFLGQSPLSSFAWPTSSVPLRLLVPEGLLVCFWSCSFICSRHLLEFLSHTSLATACVRALISSGLRTIVWRLQNSYMHYPNRGFVAPSGHESSISLLTIENLGASFGARPGREDLVRNHRRLKHHIDDFKRRKCLMCCSRTIPRSITDRKTSDVTWGPVLRRLPHGKCALQSRCMRSERTFSVLVIYCHPITILHQDPKR